MPNILEARKLAFGYSRQKLVLSDASLTLQEGEMAAMIGPNGCGKSTLVKLLAGVLQPTAGRILYGGYDVHEKEAAGRYRAIGYVPQAISRSFPFSVLEVVLSGRFPHLSRFHVENKADLILARHALEQVGVLHLEDRSLTELSGGELQLVSLARALAQDPDCLLLDEPSSSLDLKHRAELIRLLHELRLAKGVAVLMVTHDLALIEQTFDTVHCLRAGEPLFTGTPASCLQSSVLARVFDDPNIRTRQIDGRTFVWSEAS